MANNAQQLITGAAAPTAATYPGQSFQYGDTIINSAPGPGLPFAFVQTATGIANYPGTWQPVGNMQPQLTASLTAAQIILMFTTPQTVIPAPGAGLAIVLQYVIFEMTTTSTQFTGGGTVNFVYHGGAVAAATGTITAATVTTTAGTSYTYLGPSVAATGLVLPANTGVDITNGTAVFAAGTGTAVLKLAYTIVTL